MTVHVGSTFSLQRLHKRWSFPLIKSAGNCGFCHICERNRYWKTSLFVQWKCLQITKVTLLFFKLWTCYIIFINLFQFIYKKFLFTTIILSSFLLLSKSISEWVKDIYQNLFISKFPVKLNTANSSAILPRNSLKNWTIAGTIFISTAFSRKKSLVKNCEYLWYKSIWKITWRRMFKSILKKISLGCFIQQLYSIVFQIFFNRQIYFNPAVVFLGLRGVSL